MERPNKARIILVNNCQTCPYCSIEEFKKVEIPYCWSLMKPIEDVEKVLDDCPLEEIDMEWEDEYDVDRLEKDY